MENFFENMTNVYKLSLFFRGGPCLVVVGQKTLALSYARVQIFSAQMDLIFRKKIFLQTEVLFPLVGV